MLVLQGNQQSIHRGYHLHHHIRLPEFGGDDPVEPTAFDEVEKCTGVNGGGTVFGAMPN